MRTLPILTLIVLALLSCAHARAKTVTGEELLTNCKEVTKENSRENFEAGLCIGFISAALDTFSIWEASDQFAGRTHDKDYSFCIPDGVTHKQITLVFIKFLEDHPEKLHTPAARLNGSTRRPLL